MYRRFYLLCLLLIGSLNLAVGQQKTAPKPKPKPPQKNETKGQGQLQGVNGQMGAIYTLRNNFNFSILSAKYTIEPFIAYETLGAETDGKLIVLDVAVKNVATEDNYLDTSTLITLVDDKQQIYNNSSWSLQSKGSKIPEMTLRPGQGLGQLAQKDPLQVAFKLPSNARIVKIMVNLGRLTNKDEKVIRYYVAGATKEDAGEAGDPKNVITPLSDNVRDTSHPSGALALEEGKGTKGTYAPSGSFALRFDSLAFSTEPLEGNPPEEGKKFAIVTVTVKLLTEQTLTMYEVNGDEPLFQILDSDGERVKPTTYYKAKRDEAPEHDFKKGDEYTFRTVFVLPKDATAKKLTIGARSSRRWTFDVSDVK